MAEPFDRDAWINRLAVVGRAQARYLWLLLISGLFYLAVHSQISSGQPGTSDELVVPLVDLVLSAIPVWASGPAVLSTLLLAVHGTLRAYKTASIELSLDSFGAGEEYDVAPNALDFVGYTTSDSPAWIRGALLLAYPMYFALFCAEAWWLLVSVLQRRSVPAKWIFLSVGAVLTVFATWRVLAYVFRNTKRAVDVWRGKEVA